MLFEPVKSRKELIPQMLWFSIWTFVTVVGLVLKPDPAGHGTHQQLGLPPCPSALLFDRPCPGCGLTTSWTALLHGQWAFAFQAHPLGPILYVGFTATAILAIYGFFTLRRLVSNSLPASRLLCACAVVFLVFGLARMALTPHFRTLKENRIFNQVASR